jgi:hypothetical protein
VYPLPRRSLIICLAFARAASTEPKKFSVIGERFDGSADKSGLSVVLLLKSLSTVPSMAALVEQPIRLVQ